VFVRAFEKYSSFIMSVEISQVRKLVGYLAMGWEPVREELVWPTRVRDGEEAMKFEWANGNNRP
jgi:hypothetical protein